MEILYEDNHLLIVNKSNDDLVQGDKTGDTSLDQLVKKYIKDKYIKPGEVFLGVVHRIDRPVSGVVIFARTSKALTRMNKLFKQGQINKTYWAIVKNCPKPEEGRLRHFMRKNQKQNKSYCFNHETKNSKEAILDYKLISTSKNYYLIEIKLLTGRHHQIRAQLASIGCPVKGDLKYGFSRSNNNGGIGLHARSVEFIHPVKNTSITTTAPAPDNEILWKYFEENMT